MAAGVMGSEHVDAAGARDGVMKGKDGFFPWRDRVACKGEVFGFQEEAVV